MDFFLKGLVHDFGQKLVIFPDFYFRENKAEKCVLNQKKVFYDILDDRNAFLDYKINKLKKSKNWDFSKGVCQKLLIFPDFYFKENKAEKCVLNQKKVFYDIVDDRNAFLDYKNKKLK